MSNARNIANLPNGDDAPIYACRAWVNFDGTTNTAGFCTILDSGNVSTVADNGTGDYTVNFTTAMPNVNYASALSGRQDTSVCNHISPKTGGVAAGSLTIQCFNVDATPALRDYDVVFVAVFR